MRFLINLLVALALISTGLAPAEAGRVFKAGQQTLLKGVTPNVAAAGSSFSITLTDSPAIQNIAYGASFADFTNAAIGAADSNRRVVVVAGLVDNTSTLITTMTICGNTATAVGSSFDVTNAFYYSIPTGTTCTIRVNASTTIQRVGIHVFSVISTQSAPDASPQQETWGFNASPHSLTTTINSGGGGIMAMNFATAATTCTWGNITAAGATSATNLAINTAISTTAGTAARTCTGGNFIGGAGIAFSWSP